MEGKPSQSRQGVLDQWAGALRGSANFVRTLAPIYSSMPVAGSRLATEFEDPEVGEHCRDFYGFVASAVEASNDQLVALADVIAGDESVFGPDPLVRAAGEAAARAWWFLDPGLSARDRAARALSVRLESLWENQKAARALALRITKDAEGKKAMEDQAEYCTARIERVCAFADQLGFRRDVWKNRVVSFDGHIFNATDTFSSIMRTAGLEIGDAIYFMLAGGSHSIWWALRGRMTEVLDHDEPEGLDELQGFRFMATGIDLKKVNLSVSQAIVLWSSAVNRLIWAAGWSESEWDDWKDYLRSVHLLPPNEDPKT